MSIFLLSIIYFGISHQAEWRPYVHEDEEPQQQDPDQKKQLAPCPLTVEEGACANLYAESPLPEEPQYISQQFDELFTDPQKCFSFWPDNQPSEVIGTQNSLQRAFDNQHHSSMYFKTLGYHFELEPENPYFTRIGSCYRYVLNVGNTKLQLMPPQTSDDYVYESNCKTINMDSCPPEGLKNALKAIKQCSNLHMVIHNLEIDAVQNAMFLVNHALPKEVRFVGGSLLGNVAITGILIGSVKKVVVDVDQFGTHILSILCIRGIPKLDISFNNLVRNSPAQIYLSEICECLHISCNDHGSADIEQITIVIMGDSIGKAKKELKCNIKSVKFIPDQYLQVENLTLAFENEDCVGSILQNSINVQNLKLILQSINTNLEFLKQSHLKKTLLQMELIVRRPFSGEKSDVSSIFEYYKEVEKLSLGIDFVAGSSTQFSLDGLQERLTTLSLHSNTLRSRFPLDPEKATNLRAVDMQWDKDTIPTYFIPDHLANFGSISDCILENVCNKGFWRKVENLAAVKSLLIKNPIDQKIQSNAMAPLYGTMKRLAISLTPRALSGCKFALYGLEEFSLSIVSGENLLEPNEMKKLFNKFCNRHFSHPLNLIKLNLNQNCDFNMIGICDYSFPNLQTLNLERCLDTDTDEEMRRAQNYFERLGFKQENRGIHVNITFSSSRSYSNKNRS